MMIPRRALSMIAMWLAMGCGGDPAPATPAGTAVIDWSRPTGDTGSIRITSSAGDAITDVYDVRFTAEEGRALDPEVGVATLELTVERQPWHIEGHEADPVWAPNRVRLVVRNAGGWRARPGEGGACVFGTDGVHTTSTPGTFDFGARCDVLLERGSRTGGMHFSIGGAGAVQIIDAFGDSTLTPRPPAR